MSPINLTPGSPAWFKLKLLERGCAIAPRALKRIEEAFGARPLTLADYATTSGISLILGGDVFVNAPIELHNPNFVDNPEVVLDCSGDDLLLRGHGKEVAARYLPVPDYHDQLNQWGERYASYAFTHTDRVRISPVEGCAFTCTFCDLPYEYRYRTKRIVGLVDAVDRALHDPVQKASHVLISGGVPREADYGYLQACYREVARRFPHIPIDIMMVPAPNLLDLDEFHELGINQLSINLEVYSDEVARRVMPRKAQQGRASYLKFIEAACDRLGQNSVRSLLLVGLEPPEQTLKGVRALAERGCEPVLSPFRPDPSTPLGKGKNRVDPPSLAVMSDVWARAFDIAAEYGIRLGPRCIPCMHNTLCVPDGSPHYFHHGAVSSV